MSPEYALDGFFSVKSDVFSFGVVVLEIISGKRNTGFYQPEQGLSLLGYVSLLNFFSVCVNYPSVYNFIFHKNSTLKLIPGMAFVERRQVSEFNRPDTKRKLQHK
jgi:hypothetical protein